MAYIESSMIPVIQADEDTRAAFLVRVYQHLALAVVAFVAFETVLFATGIAERLHDFLFRTGGVAWLLILGGFTIVNMIASRSAHNLGNTTAQYGGLFALAAAEALIFAPFLYMAFNQEGGSATVWSAAIVTGIGFGALSLVAFTTRKDLSFLRPLIMWGSIIAIGLILAAVVFSFDLGVVFSIAMIGLAGASILYQTQKIVRHYPQWAYVGAAVSLFASLMMLFWYVLRLFMRR
ncbi:MAG: permease [Actinomycetia bacterium]|nr:permease [Actinomycetes bacterium]MCP4225014.1 permease [Actinomycetes bacterium]MCP5030691.1 permease [Actinomycetes bacterium]